MSIPESSLVSAPRGSDRDHREYHSLDDFQDFPGARIGGRLVLAEVMSQLDIGAAGFRNFRLPRGESVPLLTLPVSARANLIRWA